MTASAREVAGRLSVAVTNAVSFGVGAFLAVVFTHQIVRLFALVTVGPPVLTTPLASILAHDFSVVGFAFAVASLIGAIVFISAFRATGHGIISFRSALYPVPVVALLGAVMVAYRFLGLLLVILCLVLYVRVLRRQARRRTLGSVCLMLVALLTVPVDVTLQNVPGGPHLALASYGLPSREGFAMAERGETVIVGGCSVDYYPPIWALVW